MSKSTDESNASSFKKKKQPKKENSAEEVVQHPKVPRAQSAWGLFVVDYCAKLRAEDPSLN